MASLSALDRVADDAALRARIEAICGRMSEHRSRTVIDPSTVPPHARSALESLLPGEVQTNASGTHYRISATVPTIWSQGERIISQGREHVARIVATPAVHHSEVAAFAEHFDESVLLLDLETCGWAGSGIFLFGLIRKSDGQLIVEQLLARDYTEEKSALHRVGELAARHKVLVTFNGKSFDWPMVWDRLVFHRLRRSGEVDRNAFVAHFDVLHHARRRWKRRLPNCRLQTLERSLCHRVRRGDIPGRDIPGAYHDFVRSGDATRLATIVRHNLLDLITLLEVALRLCAPDKDPTAPSQ